MMEPMMLLGSSQEDRKCKICNTSTNGFNYGVQSCNSCKMFFRRAVDSPSVIECKRDGKCDFRLQAEKCRFCRFHQCIRSGMQLLTPGKETTQERAAKTIANLMVLDMTRRKHFLHAEIPTNLKVKDVFVRGSFGFREARSADAKLNFYDWGVMNHLSCIDFTMHFEFIRYLSPSDIQALFKYSHLMFMILVTAMSSYTSKMAVMCHPDGTDIFPEVVKGHDGYNVKFLNQIRSLLVGRLIELGVTQEEFVLLGAIILCNPVVPNLSDSGQILLTVHRDSFCQALLQYCIYNNSRNGPARFEDIISIVNVISRTQKDIDHFSSLFPILQPEHLKQNLFTDILGFLLQ